MCRERNRIAAIAESRRLQRETYLRCTQECDRSKPGGLCVCRLCNRFGASKQYGPDLGGPRTLQLLLLLLHLDQVETFFARLFFAEQLFFRSPPPNCSYYKLKLREKKASFATRPVGQHSLLFHRRFSLRAVEFQDERVTFDFFSGNLFALPRFTEKRLI